MEEAGTATLLLTVSGALDELTALTRLRPEAAGVNASLELDCF